MMRLLLIVLLILPFESFTQDVTGLLKQAGQLESSFAENEAFLKYAEVVRIQPRHLFALCKCSELCCRIGNRQPSKSKKIDYFKAGRTYADAAYRIDPNSCEANIAMAFSIARMGLVEGGREKVMAAREVKKYAEAAIRADPNNFKPYHILGKWHYEVCNLNAMEKTLAKWFYTALPEASMQQSIQYFEKSKALFPGFIPNYLELARACKRYGQKAKALQYLREMIPLPNKMLDDARAKEEGRKLLEEWQ